MFLLDVDNTLLDNDRVTADLGATSTREVGAERSERYWEIFEELRNELGYADYLGALQRYRVEHPRDPHVLRAVVVSGRTTRSPTACIPGRSTRIEHARRFGPTVILSDGDVVFQPRKVERSGLFEAVEGAC